MSASNPAPAQTMTSDRLVYLALVFGTAGLVLGAFGLLYSLYGGPSTYATRTSESQPQLIFNNTVVGALTNPINGQGAGFANFSIPGASGNLAELQMEVRISPGCDQSPFYTRCFVQVEPTGLANFSYGSYFDLSGTSATYVFTQAVGATEIYINQAPDSDFSQYDGFQAQVMIVDSGIITLH